jgi:uncharacterized protein
VPHTYLQTLTTPAVAAVQQQYGSRAAMERATEGWDTDNRLGEYEVEFIEGRDGFYLGTVGETGWPYVQYRGGPAGFLRLLDDTTLGWADFRGNRQYLSMGNLGASPKVSLFLMDYAKQRRLKILGNAEVVDVQDDAALANTLTVPGYDARVERAVVVHVVGYDWNCPQHITPRYTAAELRPVIDRLEAEAQRLREENAQLRERLSALDRT